MVVPNSLQILLSELVTVLKVFGSKSPNGSSSNKISGLDTSTSASIALTFWPPDNSNDLLPKMSKGKSSASKRSETCSAISVSGNLGNNSSKMLGSSPTCSRRAFASLSGRSVNWYNASSKMSGNPSSLALSFASWTISNLLYPNFLANWLWTVAQYTKANSWCMKPMFLLTSILSRLAFLMSTHLVSPSLSSLKNTSPLSGTSIPPNIRRRIVLPAPLGPTKDRTSPLFTSKLISFMCKTSLPLSK